MGKLEQIGALDDRAARLEQLKVFVQSHPGDAAGWYMLHLEQLHAQHGDAAEVARARALALDPLVATHFVEAAAPVDEPSGAPRVPGFRDLRLVHDGAASTLYAAIDERSGAARTLRVVRGERLDSARRQLERQLVDKRYRGCVQALDVVRADDGRPVQVLAELRDPPIEATPGALGPGGARAAIAALARALVPVHADGLIAGDLRPGMVVGKLDDPTTLAIIGVRRPEGASFGTLAGDPDRLVWFVPEEGRGEIDARADVCGLGILLWHLATGARPPYLGKRLVDGLPPTGDAALDAIIARATRNEPRDRYADAGELAAALDAGGGGTTLDGDRAGDWILHERLGGGSVADIYRATHVSDGRRAAVKVFQRRAAFEREARALATATPGVVARYEASKPELAQPFIAMELVPGETLAARLARGPMDVATSIDLARQLARALGALHAAGVIHRDVKPENVIVSTDGPLRATLIDLDAAFLIAEPGLADPDLSGTASHMAPEQWQLARDLDARTDVYGLGLTIDECLFGKHPLGAPASLAAWRAAHCDGPSPTVPSLPGLAEHRRALIERMIAHDRGKRPASMDEVLVELDREPAPPKPPRPRLPIYAGFGVLALGGIGAAIAMSRGGAAAPPDAGVAVVITPDAEPPYDPKPLAWCYVRVYEQAFLDDPANQDQFTTSLRVEIYGRDGDDVISLLAMRRRKDAAGAWERDPIGYTYHSSCSPWAGGEKECGLLHLAPDRRDGGWYLKGALELIGGDGTRISVAPDTYKLDQSCFSPP